MDLLKIPSRRTLTVIGIVVLALVAEFLVVAGTFGVRIGDRYSATSSAEFRSTGTDLHLITRNTNFSFYEFIAPHKKGFELLVLRKTTFEDRIDGREDGDSRIEVELLEGSKTRWKFEEDGIGSLIDGKVVGEYVYQVTKFGCCDAGPAFSYYSLIDGRRLQSRRDSLSSQQLQALDESLAK